MKRDRKKGGKTGGKIGSQKENLQALRQDTVTLFV